MTPYTKRRNQTLKLCTVREALLLDDRIESLVEKRALPQSISNSDSEWTSEATGTIAPRVYEQVILRMTELFSRVELDRGVIVPQHIRLFLSHMALESLHLRDDEWRQVCNADPSIESHAARIGEQIHESLLEILSNAEAQPSAFSGMPRVTLIGVLRCVHEYWCQIFPFCGRQPSPPPRT